MEEMVLILVHLQPLVVVGELTKLAQMVSKELVELVEQ